MRTHEDHHPIPPDRCDEAYNRIEVARAVRRFPVILDMLGEAALNLTSVQLLAPHLDPDNHREVLAEATGRSKREIEVLVARLSPRPDVPASVRRLPAPAQRATASVEAASAPSLQLAASLSRFRSLAGPRTRFLR